MDNITDAKRLANLLSQARINSNKSQEYMALNLNVSRPTVINWEKGLSKPTIDSFVEWYKVLGLNPTPYILQYCNPSEFENINQNDSDERINNALNKLLSMLTIEQKRQLLFIAYGDHGSDPNSVLQMVVADMHTPMNNRVNVARTIVDNYEIAEQSGTLTNLDHIMPNMKVLCSAVENGKRAAIQGERGYSSTKE